MALLTSAIHCTYMVDEELETVNRFDAGASTSVTRMDNGFLKVKATVGRVGVLKYQQADGSVRRELRHPDEVFATESLESLGLVPVTLNHPPRSEGGGLVTSENAQNHAVGAVGEAPYKINEDRVGVNMMITHDRAIDAVDNGMKQVSPGYTTSLEFKPGVFQGEPYDAIQRNIRYNHVAIVERGRAGPSVSLHLDTDAVEVGGTDNQKEPSIMSDLVKINLDGVDYEVSEQAKQALEATMSKATSGVEGLNKKLTEASARIDALEADLKNEKEAHLQLQTRQPEQLKEAVSARLELERVAVGILGGEASFAEMDDSAIKKAVVEKINPGVATKLDDADETYLNASFDFAVESHKARPNPGLGEARKNVEKVEVKGDQKDARQAYVDGIQNLWRKN